MSAGTGRSAREFTGLHMLLLAIAFFGIIIGVNATMAVVAVKSWTGLVVENSYVASQEFEEKRLAHEAQRRAGWTPELAYTSGIISLRVTDAATHAVDLAEVSVLINRPVGGHDDLALALRRGSDGIYRADAVLPPGIWEVTAVAPATALGFFEVRERIRVDTVP